jgi:hypothetical protein
MNTTIASVIWVTVGSSVSALAIDPTELFPNREALIIEAQCPDNCQGDFPVPRDRKYAEAKHGARATEPNGIEGRRLV